MWSNTLDKFENHQTSPPYYFYHTNTLYSPWVCTWHTYFRYTWQVYVSVSGVDAGFSWGGRGESNILPQGKIARQRGKPGWILPYLVMTPFWGFSIRLGPYFIPQHNSIDPLFLQKKMVCLLSHLVLPSFGQLASSPAIGLDLHVYHTQILIASHILHTEKHTDEIRRCEESCDWLHHLVCGWPWMLHPVIMHSTAQDNCNWLN